MRPGGLGLLMVRRVADELVHNAKGNEVMFIKYYTAGDRQDLP
jgi:hypothetical protein